eukprot:c17221_g1_i1.p1 GENE.c17221_g1_i1~~c17221_g1_i1.p1  ORF type:complete len:307 (+),score=56.42 c17221_g1_i1:34-954(+)
MRCLVVGGSGCLGVELVKALMQRNHAVINVDLVPFPESDGQRVRNVSRRGDLSERELRTALTVADGHCVSTFLDITDSESLGLVLRASDAEVVYWLACLIDWRPLPVEPLTMNVNFTATQTAIKFCREMCGERRIGFVFLSTLDISSASFESTQLELHDDTFVKVPSIAYIATKLLAERLVLQNNEPNFPTVVLRPVHIMGPNDIMVREASNVFVIPRLLEGCRVHQQRYEVVSTFNCAHAAVLAGENVIRPNWSWTGQSFLICEGTRLDFVDYINTIRRGIQPLARKLALPRWTWKSIGYVGDKV